MQNQTIGRSHRFVLVLVLCWPMLLSSGCREQSSRSAHTRHQVVQTVDENTSKTLQAITGNPVRQDDTNTPQADQAQADQAQADQAQAEQEAKQAGTAQQSNDKQPVGDAIDQAVQTLDQQEVTDPHEEQEVQPIEVHETLLPMVEDHWVRMHPGYEVWFDLKNRQVIVGGRISIHDGLLEMFVCPMRTLDHEAVIATVSNAEIVHAGLLAVGAIGGKPFQWEPEYKPATGPVCEITVTWQEGETRRNVRGQDMIIDRSTGKNLEHQWVFCGSHVWVDPDDPSYREYQANWGDMICVSNSPAAMIDLTIKSSRDNHGLRFQANPENIPAPGTPVLILIKPDLTTNPEPASSPKSAPATDAEAPDDGDEAQAGSDQDVENGIPSKSGSGTEY